MFPCCWVDENTETSSLSHNVISLRDWNRKQWFFCWHSMDIVLPSWAVYLLELWFFVMIYRACWNSSRDPPLRQTGWNVTKHRHRCIDLLGCGQYAVFSYILFILLQQTYHPCSSLLLYPRDQFVTFSIRSYDSCQLHSSWFCLFSCDPTPK